MPVIVLPGSHTDTILFLLLLLHFFSLLFSLIFFLFQFLRHSFPKKTGKPVDTPYHAGNSPGGQWTEFITFLRNAICVRHKKKLFFRSWDNWSSEASVYLGITNPIPPHPLVRVQQLLSPIIRFFRMFVGEFSRIIRLSRMSVKEPKNSCKGDITR